MPKIEIELDDETLQRVENSAAGFGMTVSEWIAGLANTKSRIRSVSNVWEPFANLEGMICLILLVDWDPIGIFGYPGAMDEYDSYASEILTLLESGVSHEALTAHLEHTAKQKMRRFVSRPVTSQVADKLQQFFAVWKSN